MADVWRSCAEMTAVECPTCSTTCVEAAAAEGIPYYISLPIVFVLLCFSALFSGLTLGLLSLDLVGLQIVQKGDDPYLAKCAAKIAPIRAKGNQLLCTLLLGNVAVNSATSILTSDIASGPVGFVVSTALIVLFGEILPQAACSRYALQVGAFSVPLVKVMIYSPMYFITKPLSMALDWALGKEMGNIHSSTELMEMLKLQIELGACNQVDGEMAKQVAEGALSFRDKRVEEVMTPLDDAYMLSTEVRLGYDMIREIFETGYSRVPVYGKDKHDYRGLLYTKDLMLADPEDEMKLGDFIQIFHRKVETFFKNTKLVEVLAIFKKGHTHMGLVRVPMLEDSSNPRFEIIGVLTLEDVVEEILQDEIVDETDVFVDVDNRIRVPGKRPARDLNLGIFNPAWRAKGDRLSHEEIAAVSKHLQSTTFKADGQDTSLLLSHAAVQWLVTASEVRNLEKATPLGVMVPYQQDCLYTRGVGCERCCLILQGKLGARVGREEFPSTLGAFTVIGKEALVKETFMPDFNAYLSTKNLRFLSISKAAFQQARNLDRDQSSLQQALTTLAQEYAGEVLKKDRHQMSRANSNSPVQTRTRQPRCFPRVFGLPCGGGTAGHHYF